MGQIFHHFSTFLDRVYTDLMLRYEKGHPYTSEDDQEAVPNLVGDNQIFWSYTVG